MNYDRILVFSLPFFLCLSLFINCGISQTTILQKENSCFFEVPSINLQDGNSDYFQIFNYWNENDTWDEIGPVSSSAFDTWDVGRLSCIEIDPDNDSIILAGSPSGGLYYTLNKGDSWINARLDRPKEIHGLDMFTPGISSIIIIHENDKTYWIVATGDKDHKFSFSRGVLISDDYGTSWKLLNGTEPNNLPGSNYFIRKLIRHPGNPNILYAATSRGVYRTTNALVEDPDNIQWSKIINDPDSNGEGFFDIEFHKTNSDTIIVSREYREQNCIVGNEIIWSTDGGETWMDFPGLDDILPINDQFDFFLSLLELTPANPDIMHVYIKGKTNSKNKSEYYNDHWKYIFSENQWIHLNTIFYEEGNGRNGFAISPLNENLIYCATVDTYVSTDGGYSWEYDNDVDTINGKVKKIPHIDIQDLKFNQAGTELWAASDGGPFLKKLADSVWINKVNDIGVAKILQFDHSSIDPDFYLFGGWDVGSQLYDKEQNIWSQKGEGDGYGCAFDNLEAGTFYSANYYYDHNIIYRYKNWTEELSISYGNFWNANIVVNPINHNIVYLSMGDNIVRSVDQGETWDLLVSHNELGLNPDDYLLWDMHIAESNEDYLYLRVIKINNGDHNHIFKSTNINIEPTLIEWQDVTPASIPSAWLSDIEVDYEDPDKIWASFINLSGTKIMEFDGENWIDITGNLTSYNSGIFSLAYLHGSTGGLFAGSYYGIFFREDELSDWELYKPGVPNVKPVDLKINYTSGKIVVGLDGRGLWETELPQGYGIAEFDNLSRRQVNCYPNPASEYVIIEILSINEKGAMINMYDIHSKLILTSHVSQFKQQHMISLKEFEKGVYIIQILYNGEEIGKEKLIITR